MRASHDPMSTPGHRSGASIAATAAWVGLGAPDAPRLIAFWDTILVNRPLEPGAALTIGRARDSDLVIDHKSVSRRHARVTIADPVRVEDVGSANGTRVGTLRLGSGQSVVLGAGQAITVGAATIFVQPGGLECRPLAMPRESKRASPWPDSGGMGRIARILDLAACSDVSVLLLGERGVGKALAAATVHRHSPRAERGFATIDCSAKPAAELERELLGPMGSLERAAGGSVFLGEIGALPATTQLELARLMERGKPDLRWIAASSRDLAELVTLRSFRQDLFHRLNGVTVHVPPLRERVSEIAPLAELFAREACQRLRRPPAVITRSALRALEQHVFPGNVRELLRLVESAVELAAGRPISPEHFGLDDPPFDRTVEDLTPQPGPSSRRRR